MKKHTAQDEGYRYIPLDDYQNYFYISDIDIASTCICKNHELISIEKLSDTKATFVFKNQTNISKIVEDFWDNKIEVHPLEFANARKNLKSRIYGMNKSY
jgi:hypothetical protein